MQNLDWLSKKEREELEEIAREQNKTVGEVVTEMIHNGLKNFFAIRGPQRPN